MRFSFALNFYFLKDVENEPLLPPSLAQLEIRSKRVKDSSKRNDLTMFKKSLKNLFTNRNFVIIFITYGINTGVFYSISTLLNQIISEYHPVIQLIIFN